MSTGKDTEWTIHTSRRSRRPVPVTPARKSEPAKPGKPEPSKPTPAPKKTDTGNWRQAATGTAPDRKPEPSKPTPEPSTKKTDTGNWRKAATGTAPTRKPEPSKPTPEPSEPDTASIASTDSDGSMNDDDRHTKRVKDFVHPNKLVPITNQVTSDDVSTFQQVIADGLARMPSRYTDIVALTGGYAFLVEKEINYKIRLNDPLATLPKPQTKPEECRYILL